MVWNMSVLERKTERFSGFGWNELHRILERIEIEHITVLSVPLVMVNNDKHWQPDICSHRHRESFVSSNLPGLSKDLVEVNRLISKPWVRSFC
jgi:hypothetical protein